ncbi:unnamed protein product [Dimorphilus gyrociliatus]|uniref:Uncharacterized protein n=1 Tax=Dimorphilus gyrociliatus TaxID=2664684 RepID=A0A7I8VYS8_9ANNE|nr:unnamed protein product [Dimorphilus gyrociliatus]
MCIEILLQIKEFLERKENMPEKGIIKSKSDNDLCYVYYGKMSLDKSRKVIDGDLTMSLTERRGGNNEATNGDRSGGCGSGGGGPGIGILNEGEGNEEEANVTSAEATVEESQEENDGLSKTRTKCRKYCPIVDFLILIGFSAVVAGLVVHLKGSF